MCSHILIEEELVTFLNYQLDTRLITLTNDKGFSLGRKYSWQEKAVRR